MRELKKVMLFLKHDKKMLTNCLLCDNIQTKEELDIKLVI